jgi:hypothetical protein
MKVKRKNTEGETKYTYDYKVVYIRNKTHHRLREFSKKHGLYSYKAIDMLLDFYEKKSECLCQKREA